MQDMTENELVEALRAALEARAPDSPHALRTSELRDALGGIDDRKLRRMLRKLIAAGHVRAVRRYVRALDGVMRPAAAYELIERSSEPKDQAPNGPEEQGT